MIIETIWCSIVTFTWFYLRKRCRKIKILTCKKHSTLPSKKLGLCPDIRTKNEVTKNVTGALVNWLRSRRYCLFGQTPDRHLFGSPDEKTTISVFGGRRRAEEEEGAR
jgi:hypothetical protein